MKRSIALAGNPNCGKTLIFNELTGSNQHVGNWPGVTVERKEGALKDHPDVHILDLPGIYSLSPYSPEEVATRHYLLDEKPDMIVNIVDASNLERNLYLTTQLLEIGTPMIIVLNMMDLAREKGIKLDTTALSRSLGCPVLELCATQKKGIAELVESLTGALPAVPSPIAFSKHIELAIETLCDALSCNRWTAIKVLENDSEVTAHYPLPQRHDAEALRMGLEAKLDDETTGLIAAGRYDAIEEMLRHCVQKPELEKISFSRQLDALLTHRIAGLAIFAAVMFAIYYISITTIGTWGTDWANDVLFGSVVGGWLGGFIGTESAPLESLVQLSAVLAMVLVFPVTLRRLHDVGLNGAWLYLVIAPFVLEYMCPHLPGIAHDIVMYVLYGINLLILLICFTFPGQRHPNAYGNVPARIRKSVLSLNGRANRKEYILDFVIMSAAAFGIASLGYLQLDCSPQIQDLISNGIIAGVGAVLGFLPQMAVLFLLLALLEDCGYMARVAFMMDRIFRTLGLSGKSFIPLLVSMGCGVPGVMATRTIENEKDRRMTVMLTTFVPCGAKLPIIALFAALIGSDATVATIAYFAGIGSVILGGIILRKTHMFAGSYTPFVMELPAYHMPNGISINLRAMERCKAFARKAGTIIFLSSAIIWFAQGYTWKLDYLNTSENPDAVESSILADAGHQVAPIFEPLGWGDWKPAVATVTGLVAKEVVIGTFGVLYSGTGEGEEDAAATTDAPAEAVAATTPKAADGNEAGSDMVADAESTGEEAAGDEEEFALSPPLPKFNAFSALVMAAWQCDDEVRGYEAPAAEESAEEEEEDETTGLAAQLAAAGAFTTLSGLSFMLFNLLCAPCFAACGAIRREMNSARWTWLAIGYMCVWAYVVSFLVFQYGTWAQTGLFGTGQLVAIILNAVLLYLLLRPTPKRF